MDQPRNIGDDRVWISGDRHYDYVSDYNGDGSIEYVRADLAARDQGMTGWQPIETAPKDGTEVLLLVKRRAGIPWRQLVGHFMEGGHCIEDHPPIDEGWYFWTGLSFDKPSEPTHWMPLPEPPK